MAVAPSETENDDVASPNSVSQTPKAPTTKFEEFQEGVEMEKEIETLNDLEREWLEAASTGNLELFTVVALAIGQGQYYELKDMAAKFAAIIVLQLFVPIMMVLHQMSFSGYRTFPQEDTWSFRTIGFSLYIYSVFNIYSNAQDDCRLQFQELAIRNNASWAYLVPVLIGEIINTISAVTLTLCLFNIFCRAQVPEDLVLNSVAMNYIGNIDNEFVDLFTQKVALSRFRKYVENSRENMRTSISFSTASPSGETYTPIGTENNASDEGNRCSSCFRLTLVHLCAWTKFIGTMFVGFVLGFTFLLSHEQVICDSIPQLRTTLLCLGIDEHTFRD